MNFSKYSFGSAFILTFTSLLLTGCGTREYDDKKPPAKSSTAATTSISGAPAPSLSNDSTSIEVNGQPNASVQILQSDGKPVHPVSGRILISPAFAHEITKNVMQEGGDRIVENVVQVVRQSNQNLVRNLGIGMAGTAITGAIIGLFSKLDEKDNGLAARGRRVLKYGMGGAACGLVLQSAAFQLGLLSPNLKVSPPAPTTPAAVVDSAPAQSSTAVIVSIPAVTSATTPTTLPSTSP